MALLNPGNVMKELGSKFRRFKPTDEISREEKKVANHFSDLLLAIMSGQVEMQSSVTNDLDVDGGDDDLLVEEEGECDEEEERRFFQDLEDEEDPEFRASQEVKKQKEEQITSREKRFAAVKFWRKQENNDDFFPDKQKYGDTRSFGAVSNRHRFVTDRRQLSRWEDQIIAMKPRTDSYKVIGDQLFDKFVAAREQGFSVTDFTLRLWALDLNQNLMIPLDSFKASSFFILSFKRKFGIVSRKITKFVTAATIQNPDAIRESAQSFVTHIRQLKIPPAKLFNSDQSGFEKEFRKKATLEIRGTVRVLSTAQSLNALTHSYTIQPLIDASGVLHEPLMVVLQEPAGQLPPTLVAKDKVYQHQNLFVLANKSGKVSKDILRQWVEVALKPVQGGCLLVDSLPTFKEPLAAVPAISTYTIPAGTTGLIQPLDKYFFKPYKTVIRDLSESLLEEQDIILSQRNNILKLQSLVFHQFRASRFREMIKYSWVASGYIDDYQDFVKPAAYLFNVYGKSCDCGASSRIRCAHCESYLCLNHFWNDDHHCEPQ